jgi:uncharacterized membrane protein
LTSTLDERALSERLDPIFSHAVNEALAEFTRQVAAEGGQDAVSAERQTEILNQAINRHMMQAANESRFVMGEKMASHPAMLAIMQKMTEAFPVKNSDALPPVSAATAEVGIASAPGQPIQNHASGENKPNGKSRQLTALEQQVAQHRDNGENQPIRKSKRLTTLEQQAQKSIDEGRQRIEQVKQTAYRSKRMYQVMIGGIIVMMIYGFFLPTDWQERFGLFAQPLIWITATLPGFAKLARFSTIPEVLRGFYGLALYIMPLFGVGMYIYLTRYLNLSIHITFANVKRPFWEKFCIYYLFLCPVIIVCLWLVYLNPISDHGPSPHAYVRQFIYFNQILDNQFSLAFYGSMLTMAGSVSICLLIHLFVSPIVLLVKIIKGEEQWRR